MTDGWFAKRLRGALRTLDAEYPGLYRRMVEVMSDRQVLLRVDDETVGICFTAEGGPVLRDAPAPAVRCATTSAAIVTLAEGAKSIEDALWCDDILLQGAIEDLLPFHDALMAFLHGAVRSPSFPEHLSSFKREAPRRGSGSLTLPPNTLSAT